jgi:DNA-binding transcriptional regulator YiaG
MASWVRWSKKENEILEEYVGFHSPEDISLILKKQGFNRTPEAVRSRFKVLKISYAREFDNLSLSRIGKLLGVSRSTTSSWHRTGKIKGKPLGKGREIVVKYEEVRNFLKKYSQKLKTVLDKDGLNFFLGGE